MRKLAVYQALTAVLVSILGSGCRFGNHADNPQPLKNEGQYRSVEFFFTTPKSFETRVYLNGISGPDALITTNDHAPLASIPSSLLGTFSDPVYFVIPTDPNSSPFFRHNANDTRIYTTLDAAGQIAEDYAPDASVLWSDENCRTRYEIIHEGTFNRNNSGNVTYPDGSIAPVAGSLNLTYTFARIIQSINGPDHCTADLTRLAECYTSGTGCSANELSSARALFDLYVKQTGVLKIEDAAKIKAMEYIVHYE